MFETNIYYPAIFMAAIANMLIGMLWYSPMLFGKQWRSLMGITANGMKAARKKMGVTYGLSFVMTLIMGYIFALLVRTTQVLTFAEGVQLGALLWLGFVSTVQLTDVVFSGKSWKLYLINTGYQLTALLAMGAILAQWA